MVGFNCRRRTLWGEKGLGKEGGLNTKKDKENMEVSRYMEGHKSVVKLCHTTTSKQYNRFMNRIPPCSYNVLYLIRNRFDDIRVESTLKKVVN